MRILIASALIFLVSASALAHHSRTYFELDHQIEVKGTVMQVKWRNPHVRYVLERVNEQGVTETWSMDGQTPGGYEQEGWFESSLVVGDVVTFRVYPNSKNTQRSPNKQSGLLNAATRSDGSTLPPKSEGELAAGTESPTEEFGRSGSKDFSGNWSYTLILDEIKLLGSEPPQAWPLTERGQAQVDNFNIDTDPIFECIEAGAPRMINYLYDRKWIRFEDRIEIISEATPSDQNRVIWLDGRARSADFKMSATGFSTGHFDQDGALVVRTDGFSAVRWGLETGIDSSEQKTLVERYRLTNGSFTGGMRMIFSVTVTDPVYLRRPVTVYGVYDLTDDREYAEFKCDPESASAHLEFN
ncbi:MAG: hypothetical protein HOG96_01270 [Porticoccaceae bacterium]|nr:hypothetical protein [Porticoccaceae bacterium]MBT7752806.1 hypothetical protein [Porticoccaceae bacterium]